MRFCRLLVLAVIAGCASQEQFTNETGLKPSEAATVIVYRPQTSFHSMNPERPFLYLDDKQAGKLGVGQLITLTLAPGPHKFTMWSSALFMPAARVGDVDLTLEPGQTYYLRYEYGFSGIAGTPGMLVPVGNHSFGVVNRDVGEAKR
jgi:uncharacterized protein DUF2846